MVFNIIYIIIGFVFLILGADILVKGSSNLAKRFGIPEIIIGLTIVCIGTSMPELIITITSATKGYTDLIVGNAIGSNLCNLLLILGFCSIIGNISIEKDIKKIHLPIAIFSSILVVFLGNVSFFNTSFQIDKFEGFILILIFIIYFSYPIFIAIKDILKTEAEEKITHLKRPISAITAIIFIVLGIMLLKFGGDFVVDGSVEIANYFNISERIIGLTIIAIGTALPELVTSVIAILNKDSDLAVGNLIGSCMLNLWLILGIGAVITPLEFSIEFNYNLILLTFASLLILIFTLFGKKNTITKPKGVVLLLIFIVYILKLFIA